MSCSQGRDADGGGATRFRRHNQGSFGGGAERGGDGDMVGMELGNTEGSTYGMMVGGTWCVTGDGEWTNLTSRQYTLT
jgi:hypothetical protein